MFWELSKMFEAIMSIVTFVRFLIIIMFCKYERGYEILWSFASCAPTTVNLTQIQSVDFGDVLSFSAPFSNQLSMMLSLSSVTFSITYLLQFPVFNFSTLPPWISIILFLLGVIWLVVTSYPLYRMRCFFHDNLIHLKFIYCFLWPILLQKSSPTPVPFSTRYVPLITWVQ